jgi:hypothetical protein
MNAPESFFLPDTQALPDLRNLPIQNHSAFAEITGSGAALPA